MATRSELTVLFVLLFMLLALAWSGSVDAAKAPPVNGRPTSITLDPEDASGAATNASGAEPTASPAEPTWPADIWQHEIIDPYGSGWWTSLALDAAGRPHVVYAGHDSQYRGSLKYAVFDGTAWQFATVDDEISSNWYPSLALDSHEEPHVAYHHAHDRLLYAHFYNGTWHNQTVDSGSNDIGEHASIEVDSARMPHIAYSDETANSLKYARRIGATWQIVTVASMPAASQAINLDLALDSAQRPHICYYDDTADALKHAAYDGSTWHIEVIASAVFYNGQRCSIAIDSHNHSHITYRDLGLFYADYDGAQWRVTEVDNDQGAGDESSLALDAASRPHIAYSDSPYPNKELRYAYFDGFDWQIEIVDTTTQPGDRALGVSLALNATGSPHITYFMGADSPVRHAWKIVPPTRWLYLPAVLRQ